MMKLFILADMEGACGIYRQDHFTPGTEGWKTWGRVCLTEDLRVIARGARLAGVREITIRDYHAEGFNVIPEGFPEFLEIISGQCIRPFPIIGKRAKYPLAFLVAQHASVDTPGAFFPHIFHHHVKSISVNGEVVSETEILAGVLGEGFGTPVGLISGDPVLLKDLEGKFPWAELVPCSKDLKDFETPEKRKPILQEERDNLFQKTQEAWKRRDYMKPFLFPGPVVLEVELHMLESPLAKNRWGFKRISDTRFSMEGESFPDAYWALFKFLFIPKMLYPIAAGLGPALNRISFLKARKLLRSAKRVTLKSPVR